MDAILLELLFKPEKKKVGIAAGLSAIMLLPFFAQCYASFMSKNFSEFSLIQWVSPVLILIVAYFLACMFVQFSHRTHFRRMPMPQKFITVFLVAVALRAVYLAIVSFASTTPFQDLAPTLSPSPQMYMVFITLSLVFVLIPVPFARYIASLFFAYRLFSPEQSVENVSYGMITGAVQLALDNYGMESIAMFIKGLLYLAILCYLVFGERESASKLFQWTIMGQFIIFLLVFRINVADALLLNLSLIWILPVIEVILILVAWYSWHLYSLDTLTKRL